MKLPISQRPPAPRGRLVMRDVHKNFADGGMPAVRAITLECEPGEFVVLVGPSGCGKTTLLGMAAGMIRPDAGEVSIDAKPVDGPGPDRALVFQDHGLFPWLTAAENIEFGLKMLGMSASERADRVHEALCAVHLRDEGHKLVHELSGGMRQRIAIARALVLDPAVLLMDEPFAALDAQTRTMLQAHLQEIWCRAHKTVLFVTHSVGEAVRLADRVVVMHARPGEVRKIIPIELAHPRDFDGAEIGELVHVVRCEIEDEVKRAHERMGEAPASLDPSGVLGRRPPRVGGGV